MSEPKPRLFTRREFLKLGGAVLAVVGIGEGVYQIADAKLSAQATADQAFPSHPRQEVSQAGQVVSEANQKAAAALANNDCTQAQQILQSPDVTKAETVVFESAKNSQTYDRAYDQNLKAREPGIYGGLAATGAGVATAVISIIPSSPKPTS